MPSNSNYHFSFKKLHLHPQRDICSNDIVLLFCTNAFILKLIEFFVPPNSIYHFNVTQKHKSVTMEAKLLLKPFNSNKCPYMNHIQHSYPIIIHHTTEKS